MKKHTRGEERTPLLAEVLVHGSPDTRPKGGAAVGSEWERGVIIHLGTRRCAGVYVGTWTY